MVVLQLISRMHKTLEFNTRRGDVAMATNKEVYDHIDIVQNMTKKPRKV